MVVVVGYPEVTDAGNGGPKPDEETISMLSSGLLAISLALKLQGLIGCLWN